jgi:hypothetical protein
MVTLYLRLGSAATVARLELAIVACLRAALEPVIVAALDVVPELPPLLAQAAVANTATATTEAIEIDRRTTSSFDRTRHSLL